jgi:hypothetical protein
MLVDETDKVQARALAELKSNAIDLLDDDVDASAVVSRLAPLPAACARPAAGSAAAYVSNAAASTGAVSVKAEKKT